MPPFGTPNTVLNCSIATTMICSHPPVSPQLWQRLRQVRMAADGACPTDLRVLGGRTIQLTFQTQFSSPSILPTQRLVCRARVDRGDDATVQGTDPTAPQTVGCLTSIEPNQLQAIRRRQARRMHTLLTCVYAHILFRGTYSSRQSTMHNTMLEHLIGSQRAHFGSFQMHLGPPRRRSRTPIAQYLVEQYAVPSFVKNKRGTS